MISSDLDALKIILYRLNQIDINQIEYEILSNIKELMIDYSFVDNQTYPRPSHPNILKRKDAYFTLIAILLSLRTTLENEVKAVDKFIEKYKSIDDVINCNKNELIQTISCAGMPTKKAKTILDISNCIFEKYNGNINNINVGSIDEIREKLMQLPGIGEKSADCMLELAFNLPSIVIDTNVFRVISRFYYDEDMNFNKKDDILKIKKFLEDNVIKDYKIYQIIHTIILLHGKNTCKSKPNCDICKINSNCKYFENNNIYNQLKLFKL